LYLTAWILGPLSNRWLLAGIGTSLVALLTVIYVPPLTEAFETETLSIAEWLVVLAFAVAAPTVIEAQKLSPWRLRR
jgi:magnesium-transporting ATPase (P-type)